MDDTRAAGLTRAILSRTTGSTCQHLRPLACDYVDGSLEGTRALLVRGHLAHCEGCTALVARLRSAKASLPAFAEADPGPWFTQRVLRASAAAPAPSWWSRLVHRPRIALETAYLATALCVLALSLRPGDEARTGPLGAGASAVARGLHAVADALKTTPQPAPAEPSGGPLRPSP